MTRLDADTFKAHLQGAERVTLGKQNTITRTTESILQVSPNSKTVGTTYPKAQQGSSKEKGSRRNLTLRISPVQPSTNSDDRKRRGQGRRWNFPNRLTAARLRLPRQPATANGAPTPGFSFPFPSHSGVFGPPPLFVCCSPRWFESTSFCDS